MVELVFVDLTHLARVRTRVIEFKFHLESDDGDGVKKR